MNRIMFPMLIRGLIVTKSKNRWFRFGVRTLLVLTALFCIVFSLWSWFDLKMQNAKRQEKALHALQMGMAGVNFDYEFNIRDGGYYQIPDAKVPEPVWLKALLGEDYFGLLGDDFFRTVIFIEFDHINIPGVRPKITDTDLKYLEDLPHIRSVGLSNTPITDAGLANLKGLTQLNWLRLQNTQVTDAGLEHLRKLTQLNHVDLRGTRVTENGIRKLKQELPTCIVESDYDR